MVKAWFLNDNPTNPQEENHFNPPRYVPIDQVTETTAVEYFSLDVNTYKTDGVLDKIKKERGYDYEDEFACTEEHLVKYEKELKAFYTEHLHPDDEIRFLLDGSGFFDVRDQNDRWIRIAAVAGDMLVIPAGIYHRFTMDKGNYIKAKRLFTGGPVWTAYNRPADDMECRKQYLKRFKYKI